ncbi:hypothetical protein K438DRAFT_1152350 [Mycena galopus ATCC 62051]|nr:hypothetical protein K438DRAFT_1152350 [Mycena galopus ATCC 62051]
MRERVGPGCTPVPLFKMYEPSFLSVLVPLLLEIRAPWVARSPCAWPPKSKNESHSRSGAMTFQLTQVRTLPDAVRSLATGFLVATCSLFSASSEGEQSPLQLKCPAPTIKLGQSCILLRLEHGTPRVWLVVAARAHLHSRMAPVRGGRSCAEAQDANRQRMTSRTCKVGREPRGPRSSHQPRNAHLVRATRRVYVQDHHVTARLGHLQEIAGQTSDTTLGRAENRHAHGGWGRMRLRSRVSILSRLVFSSSLPLCALLHFVFGR